MKTLWLKTIGIFALVLLGAGAALGAAAGTYKKVKLWMPEYEGGNLLVADALAFFPVGQYSLSPEFRDHGQFSEADGKVKITAYDEEIMLWELPRELVQSEIGQGPWKTCRDAVGVTYLYCPSTAKKVLLNFETDKKTRLNAVTPVTDNGEVAVVWEVFGTEEPLVALYDTRTNTLSAPTPVPGFHGADRVVFWNNTVLVVRGGRMNTEYACMDLATGHVLASRSVPRGTIALGQKDLFEVNEEGELKKVLANSPTP